MGLYVLLKNKSIIYNQEELIMKTKKLISLLLSVAMILTTLVVPMSASAATATTWETVFEHDFDSKTQAPLILSDGRKDGTNVYGVISGDANGNSTKYGRFDANDYNDGATGNHRKGWDLDNTYTTGKMAVEFDFKREDNNSDGFVYLSRADGNDIFVLAYFKTDGTVGAFANNTDVTKYSDTKLTLNTWYTYRAEIDLSTRAFEAWIVTKDGNSQYAHIKATAPAYIAYNKGWLQNNDFAAFGAMKDVCVDNISVAKQVQTTLPEGTIFVHDFDNQTQAPLILSDGGKDGSGVYGVFNGDAYGNDTKYGRFDANDYNDGATGNHRKGWKFGQTYSTEKIAVEFDFRREDNNSDGYVYLSRADGNDILVLAYFKTDGTVGAFANNTDVTKYSNDALTLNTWYTYRAEIDLSTRAFEAWIVDKSNNSQYAYIQATVPAYIAYNQGWLQNNDFAAFGAMKDVCIDNISVVEVEEEVVEEYVPEEGTVFWHNFDNKTQAPVLLSNNGSDGTNAYGIINGDANGNDTKYGKFAASDYNDGASGWHRKGWKFDNTLSTGNIRVKYDFMRSDNNQTGFVYLSNAGGSDLLVLTFFKPDGTIGAFADSTDVTKYSNDAIALNTWYSYEAEIDLDTKAFEAWITNKSDNTEYAHIKATVPDCNGIYGGWINNNDFAAIGAMKDVSLDNISIVEFEKEEVVIDPANIFSHNFDQKTQAPVILSDGGKDGTNAYGIINGDANGNSTKYGKFATTYTDGANGWHRKGWTFDKLSSGKIAVEFDFMRENNDKKGYVYLSNTTGGDLLVLTFFESDGTIGAFANNTDVTKYSEDALALNTWYNYRAEIDIDTRGFEAWITKASDSSEYAHINSVVPEKTDMYLGWIADNDITAFGAMLDVCVDNIDISWNYEAPDVSDETVAIRNVFGDTQTDMTAVNPNVTAIDIDFGTLVNEASLEGAVTLTKTNAPTADIALTAELIGTVYTVGFDPLVPDSTYELKVSKDVAGKGGETLGTDYVLSFTTAAQGGFDAAINGVKVGGADVEDDAVIPNGTVTVDVSLVNTSGENKEASVFIAYYAGNELQYFDVVEVLVNNGKLVEKDDVTFTLTRESDTDCVKIMVWDGNVTPLCIHKEFK